MPQSPTTHTHYFLSQCTHETCQQLNSGPPCFLKLHCHPRATLQPRTHCAYSGLPQVPASCALHSFCDPSASPHPWTHPVSRPPDCPPCPDLSWTSWATLPILPLKSQPYGVSWPHIAPPGTPRLKVPRAEQGQVCGRHLPSASPHGAWRDGEQVRACQGALVPPRQHP